jgi:NADPH:quinone reductase-like Zn-dependent oxidoreductase
MRIVQIDRFGIPHEVVRCRDVAKVSPARGEIVFEVLASPINPADLLLIEGNYTIQPPLPATPGAEAVGRVIEVGDGVGDFRVGDHVLSPVRENWAEHVRVPADRTIKIRSDLPVRQAAMLRINPATAYLLVTKISGLGSGSWMIQNGANSAVGKLVIQNARNNGIKTVNIVRNKEAVNSLTDLGADIVVVDGEDLPQRVREMTGGAEIGFGLDCVAGAAASRMVRCVSDGGLVCVYGNQSGQDSQFPTRSLTGRGVRITGFNLPRHLSALSRPDIVSLYGKLADGIVAGQIKTHVEAVYDIGDISAAAAHAERGGRQGKILLMPNGID